jgi:hypothetical protein
VSSSSSHWVSSSSSSTHWVVVVVVVVIVAVVVVASRSSSGSNSNGTDLCQLVARCLHLDDSGASISTRSTRFRCSREHALLPKLLFRRRLQNNTWGALACLQIVIIMPFWSSVLWSTSLLLRVQFVYPAMEPSGIFTANSSFSYNLCNYIFETLKWIQ